MDAPCLGQAGSRPSPSLSGSFNPYFFLSWSPPSWPQGVGRQAASLTFLPCGPCAQNNRSVSDVLVCEVRMITSTNAEELVQKPHSHWGL